MPWPPSIHFSSWPTVIKRTFMGCIENLSTPLNKRLAPAHLKSVKDIELTIGYADTLLEIIDMYQSLETTQETSHATDTADSFEHDALLKELTRQTSLIDCFLSAFKDLQPLPEIPVRSTSLANFPTRQQTKAREAVNFFNNSSNSINQGAESVQRLKNSEIKDPRDTLTNSAHQEAWDRLHGTFKPKVQRSFEDFINNSAAAMLCPQTQIRR